MKKIVLYLFLFPFFGGCSVDLEGFDSKIVDPTKEAVLHLSALPSQKNIHRVRVYFKGYLDGTAVISIGGVSRAEEVSGTVNLDMSNEWYLPECIIKYDPLNVKSGNLKLYYRFEEI